MATAPVIELVSPYVPRRAFMRLHSRETRWFAGVAHRRAGKTVACVNELIKGAAECLNPNPRLAYIAPYLNQAKDIAWSYLKQYSEFLPGRKVNESELYVEFPASDGSVARIRIYGADNPDRLRGIYLDGVVLDEYGDMDPGMWAQVIRPALADRKGWAGFIGTPKGKNAFHKVWLGAQNDDTWTTLLLKASESGLLDPAEVDAARKDMDADTFDQEFECSFEAAVKGAYYGEELNKLERDGRYRSVPHEPMIPVHTAWDLGMADSTVIWFFQAVGNEFRFIDCLKGEGVGLDWYVRELQSRQYVWGKHYLPHDVQVRELGTGKSRKEVLEGMGIQVTVCPNLPIPDGVNAVRAVLPVSYFDNVKCAAGFEALRMYRRDFDDKRQEFRQNPLHDWTSHYADALRYMAVGYRDAGAPRKIVYNLKGII